MRRSVAVAVLVVLLALAACGGEGAPEPGRSATGSTTAAPDTGSPTPSPPASSPPASPTPPGSPSPTPSPTTASATPEPSADPRWRFYTDDETAYTSPWFTGAHRIMIGFGCTDAPYYDPDPRCEGGNGFHHGIDVAIPCGTDLLSGVDATVADPGGPGSPGPAYGDTAFRLRTDDADILIGHPEEVFVSPGESVRAGQRIATVGDRGAPDGCHLHFEVRTPGGGVSSASDPAGLLDLSS